MKYYYSYTMEHTSLKIKTVSVKFPIKDIEYIEKLVSKGNAITKSDFIRQATREKIVLSKE